MADRFDFCSAAFDPLAALLAACVRPPVPGARPLDNLHKCRWLLPEGHPDALRDQHAARSKVRSSAACRGCALAGGRFRNAGTRLLLPQALSETPSS